MQSSKIKEGVILMTLISFTKHKPVHKRHLIELKLRDVSQLFNSMDPSPFQEKDLDQDAEDFIESWAFEYPLQEPLTLRVHLSEPPESHEIQGIEEAIHHFFAYKAELNRLDFSQLMREGRWRLMIGLGFLASCLTLAGLLSRFGQSTGLDILREGLTIVGWVAMWNPLELYLYQWWPLRRTGKVYQKMSRMPVEVRIPHVSQVLEVKSA